VNVKRGKMPKVSNSCVHTIICRPREGLFGVEENVWGKYDQEGNAHTSCFFIPDINSSSICLQHL